MLEMELQVLFYFCFLGGVCNGLTINMNVNWFGKASSNSDWESFVLIFGKDLNPFLHEFYSRLRLFSLVCLGASSLKEFSCCPPPPPATAVSWITMIFTRLHSTNALQRCAWTIPLLVNERLICCFQ